jgi:hypothetical protein
LKILLLNATILKALQIMLKTEGNSMEKNTNEKTNHTCLTETVRGAG